MHNTASSLCGTCRQNVNVVKSRGCSEKVNQGCSQAGPRFIKIREIIADIMSVNVLRRSSEINQSSCTEGMTSSGPRTPLKHKIDDKMAVLAMISLSD